MTAGQRDSKAVTPPPRAARGRGPKLKFNFVYILASDSRELCIGVTGNLERRVSQRRAALKRDGCTAKRETKRLVYCETTDNVLAAITREKQIKVWTRRRKLELIETVNPDWKDLAESW